MTQAEAQAIAQANPQPISERDAAINLYRAHLDSGEPLGLDELTRIWRNGVADWVDFDDVGGGVFAHKSFRATED